MNSPDPTEQAAALYRQLDDGLFKLREAGAAHKTQERYAVELLLEFRQSAYTQGRAAGLREGQIEAVKKVYNILEDWLDESTMEEVDRDMRTTFGPIEQAGTGGEHECVKRCLELDTPAPGKEEHGTRNTE